MSNKVMTWVWDHSKAKDTDLLMLVALADNANDEGITWPSTTTLARKVRYKNRQTASKCLQRCQDKYDDELFIDERAGTSNRYIFAAYRRSVGLPELPEDANNECVQKWNNRRAELVEGATRELQVGDKMGATVELQGAQPESDTPVQPDDCRGVQPEDCKGATPELQNPSLNPNIEPINRTLNEPTTTESTDSPGAEKSKKDVVVASEKEKSEIELLYFNTFGQWHVREKPALAELENFPQHWIEEAIKITRSQESPVQYPAMYMLGITKIWRDHGYDGPGATVAAAISADDEQGDRPPSKPTRGAVSSITQNVLNSVAADHSQEADDWRAALVQLSVQIDAETFHTKFREAVLIGIDDDVFIIGVPDEHTRSYLEGRLIRSIGRILRDACGRDIELRFEVWTPGLDAIKQAEAVIESVGAQDDVPVAPVGEAVG